MIHTTENTYMLEAPDKNNDKHALTKMDQNLELIMDHIQAIPGEYLLST